MGRRAAKLSLVPSPYEDEDFLPSKQKRATKQRYPQPVKASSNIWFRDKLEPRTYGQEFYINTIAESDITLCTGPAGCGKTWIVARLALEDLAANRVSKIVVTKPILEAGDTDQIGFLPGTIEEKILPHFYSVLDCFEDHVGPTITKKLMDEGKIVFLPSAYARGRDLKNCLTGETMVMLASGEQITLAQLVEEFNSGKEITVKSFHHETNEVVDSKISYAFKTEVAQPLLKVSLEDGTVLKVTYDHKLFVEGKGYVEAQYLTEDDVLLKV